MYKVEIAFGRGLRMDLKSKDIVRNGAKIKSVQENGRFLMEVAEKHGSAAPARKIAWLSASMIRFIVPLPPVRRPSA